MSQAKRQTWAHRTNWSGHHTKWERCSTQVSGREPQTTTELENGGQKQGVIWRRMCDAVSGVTVKVSCCVLCNRADALSGLGWGMFPCQRPSAVMKESCCSLKPLLGDFQHQHQQCQQAESWHASSLQARVQGRATWPCNTAFTISRYTFSDTSHSLIYHVSSDDLSLFFDWKPPTKRFAFLHFLMPELNFVKMYVCKHHYTYHICIIGMSSKYRDYEDDHRIARRVNGRFIILLLFWK